MLSDEEMRKAAKEAMDDLGRIMNRASSDFKSNDIASKALAEFPSAMKTIEKHGNNAPNMFAVEVMHWMANHRRAIKKALEIATVLEKGI